jgi:O-antigen/teichoic acid export membrane protein
VLGLEATSPVVLAALVVWITASAAGGIWLAGRLPGTASSGGDDVVRRVLRNASIPIVSQLLIRAIDLAIAIVVLRLLGPEGNGQFAIAVVVWLYVKTVSDFGLSLLATRDIALDRSSAGRVVGATTILRLIVLALTALPVALYVAAGRWSDTLASSSAIAIALLYLSIIPSSYAEALNAALNGFERMDAAAGLNIVVNVARAPLVVLLAATRLEVVGVALAALGAALLSALLFQRAFGRLTAQAVVWSLGSSEARGLAARSWPLLVNALLVNLFFRVDVFLVQAWQGDAALGMYDAAYKLINLVIIVPAYATLAIFPLLALRSSDPDALTRAGRTASYVLVWLAWGIVVAVSALADLAIRILAGADFVPDAATLLRILIWFAPLSFLNGVIQYVLVAAEQQRRIAPAFAAAVLFNIALNAALIPLYGARAAAAVTVATEVVILTAFWLLSRGGPVHVIERAFLLRLLRPSTAGIAASVLAVALAAATAEVIAAAAAAVVFVLASLLLGVAGPTERDLLRRAIGRRPVGDANGLADAQNP